MRRRTKIILGAVVIVALITIASFISILRYGFSAHDEPTKLEVVIARTVRHWAVPADLRDRKNPVPSTPAVLAEARAHFADHCATCHGNNGKGDSGLGKQMFPRTPDMTLPATQSLSDGEIFSIIENGVRLTGMPGFGSGTAESAYGSWSIVHFIRHMPNLTPEEIAAMERLNPKSPEEYEQMKQEEAFLSEGEATPEPTTPQPAHHH